MSRRIRQRYVALLSGAVLLPLLGLGHASAKSTPLTGASAAGIPIVAQPSGEQPPPSAEQPPPPEPTPAQRAVDYARQQVGKPYHYGSSGPSSYDCSGLTLASWRAGGRSLPHSSRAQFDATARVSLADIQPGDLLFFGSPIHHVGIYVGDGQMVEAPRSGGRVRYASIQRRDLVGVGRP